MARSLGNSIADSLELGVDYAEKLLKDVTPDKFARLASLGGSPIQSNHGAFIYGHLSLYAPQVTMHLGDVAPEIVIPDGFEKLFSKDATCVDDPAGDIYPSQEQVTRCFIDGYRKTCAALREVSNEPLEQVNPTPGRLGERFPTVGSVVAFYCGGHLMLHLGQMSAWRRMMGLSPA